MEAAQRLPLNVLWFLPLLFLFQSDSMQSQCLNIRGQLKKSLLNKTANSSLGEV